MFKRLTVLAASGALVASYLLSPALAQINPFDDTLNLKQSDLEMIQHAARQGLDGKDVGTVVEWSNPKTGNKGTVTLLRSFEYDGHQCREVQHLVDPKGGSFIQRYVNTICKQTDGTWKG